MKSAGVEGGLVFPNPDLLSKQMKSRKQFGRQKSRLPGNGVRLRKDSAVNKSHMSSRPETPLLRWKFNEGGEDTELSNEEKEETLPPDDSRKVGRRVNAVVSARKLGAGIWRMQLPELPSAGDNPGFQSGDNHVGVPLHSHPDPKMSGAAPKDWVQNHVSVSGSRNRCFSKVKSEFQLSLALEGATKWDPTGCKVFDETKKTHGQQKIVEREEKAASTISTLKSELEEAHAKIHELETEKQSSKKKIEHFLRKLSEERAAWRSREHEKVRAIIDDIKVDLNRERKNRQRLEIVNSKLVNELAEAKLSSKRYKQEFDKERKSRELIEEVCEKLATKIGEEKAEVEALKRESMNLREEVEEERKMLQMAEVWREERVQMKLIDAKVVLEDQYTYMNRLISDLESVLSSRNGIKDTEGLRKAELLRQAATSLNIQDFSEFTYEPPTSDDIFSIIGDVNFGGNKNEQQIKQCLEYSPASLASKIHTVSPQISMMNKDITERHSHPYVERGEIFEEDRSEWETVSHAEDQGSSFSPDGSDTSVNDSGRDSDASRSRIEWEGNHADMETPISEVISVPSRELKKASSISRLWRSCQSNGENYKIISMDGINGRLSNGAFVSPDCGSGIGGLTPDIAGQWSSPEPGNAHITKGTKGCIEWPRSTQKGSLKSKLLEARIESQRVQLRHVLKQKI